MRKLESYNGNYIEFPESDLVKLGMTTDDNFSREAIVICPNNADGQAISIDLMVNQGDKVYHIARLNFAIPEDGNGKTNMDVIVPDDARQDILVFSDGAMRVNWRNLTNKDATLAFVCVPGEPLRV